MPFTQNNLRSKLVLKLSIQNIKLLVSTLLNSLSLTTGNPPLIPWDCYYPPFFIMDQHPLTSCDKTQNFILRLTLCRIFNQSKRWQKTWPNTDYTYWKWSVLTVGSQKKWEIIDIVFRAGTKAHYQLQIKGQLHGKKRN